MGSALLGASTFHAKQHGADECDTKGLPLTPNSINITGRFQALRELRHAHLCAYLDLIKTKNGRGGGGRRESHKGCTSFAFFSSFFLRLHTERLIAVAEYYDDCLAKHIQTGEFSQYVETVLTS